jgi:hypothetical protein
VTTETALLIEPLTYWLRIEDIVSEPRIGIRLINKAAEGQFLVESGDDLSAWIDEAEALLHLVDSELRLLTGSDYPQLSAIVMSMPPIESLRSMLALALASRGGPQHPLTLIRRTLDARENTMSRDGVKSLMPQTVRGAAPTPPGSTFRERP